jgi:iduronate 2-sulfatase
LNPAVAAKPAWKSTWHSSGEFRGNYGHAGNRDPDHDPEYARELRRAYAACVSYTDFQIGKVLDRLHELKLDSNTIVVVWSDHGFLLGEHAIWGKHCLYERALRSPLMIRHPALQLPGATSDAIVETVDVFPTLADLCRLPAPEGLDGRSLLPQLLDPSAASTKPALGFWSGGQRTVRTDRWRLISKFTNGDAAPQFELFDYQDDPNETRNHADENPVVIEELHSRLKAGL